MFRKIFSRSVHCLSCGSKFHRIQYGPGFQNPTKNPSYPSFAEAQEKSFQELLSNLSEEQKRAVGFKNLDVPIHEVPARILERDFKKRSKQEREFLQCRWCIDAMQGREYPVVVPKVDVIGEIPNGYQIVHVIDAMDFPMTVCKDIVLKYGPRVVFAITRCDLLADHHNKLGKLKNYMMEEVFDKMKVDPRNVHLLSAKRNWNLEKFAECLKDGNALVGKTGSGKTTLAVALSGSILPYPTWELPFTTQRADEYKTKPEFRSKLILDLPSLPESTNKGKGIYGLIRPKFMRKIVAGQPMTKLGNKYSRPSIVAKPGQSISIGGMVGFELLKAKPGQAIHVWPIIGGFSAILGRKVSSIEKIYQLNTSPTPQHDQWNILDSPKESEPLQHQMSFQIQRNQVGQSVVVRGLGMLQAKLYGNMSEPYNINVHTLPGVELGLRTELLEWFRLKN
ncbi:Genetic interactor of prohibitins 3, mitochondrial [Wickerhamiella sorbophila]|uniref:Genetic interactor of prohibitins 3, mitochondrial n=1 Tax=Wickerhamiella sorbophila TaxID=45607 RepID=A0A2T0FFN0_9ASCO|nr:Genetic interactor of prohibitins 3, mitochondrial [Wickerhamiella sorbophila]PRT53759.1 Genetic interactor of prohibitins 3, mitochondrial [Wickerhamiella sorbophila]